MLQTRYKRGKKTLDEGGGELLVETAGYVPSEVLISEMIMAGIRLGEHRAELYDLNAEDDGDFEVPVVRMSGFDMADASQLEAALQEKFSAQTKEILDRREAERLEAEKAAKKVEGEPNGSA